MSNLSRRSFVASVAAAAPLAIAGGAVPAAAVQVTDAPPDIGRKFHPDGRVRAFAGNTIVCHLDQQGARSAAFDALLDFYRQAPARGYMRKVTALPPSSYHMTIYGGATDADRRLGRWPVGVAPDATIEECNRIVAARLRGLDIASPDMIGMRIDGDDPGYDGNTLRLPLVPATEADAAALRVVRDRLADVLGTRATNHDRYAFHVTLGYLVSAFTTGERDRALADMRALKALVTARAGGVEVGRSEYCVFEDMFAFKRQFYL